MEWLIGSEFEEWSSVVVIVRLRGCGLHVKCFLLMQ